MAVYRKKLVDKDGNTIIPAVGDIYGTVYTATLSSATAGGRADYEFTPDTPLENNKVYAVKFPAPTVNNATIILGDGVSSGSILVPTVAATDAPNYELLNTDMINDTEPLLLMYNGVQWVCLNQKKKVASADLENNAVTSSKIDWTTSLFVYQKTTTTATVGQSFNTYMTLDITNFPTGAKFIVFSQVMFSGSEVLTSFLQKNVYSSQSTQDSRLTSTWGNTVTAIDIFTKETGKNSVYIQIMKDNTSNVTTVFGKSGAFLIF